MKIYTIAILSFLWAFTANAQQMVTTYEGTLGYTTKNW